MLTFVFNSGDGAYSEVYKVKRNSDSQIYALKKVSVALGHSRTENPPIRALNPSNSCSGLDTHVCLSSGSEAESQSS